MRGMEKLDNMFGQLEELGAKYSDYKWANNSQMVFHDPETEDQRQKANKIARQTQSILWLVTAAFVVFLVLTIAFADSTSGTVIMLLLSGIAGTLAITNQVKKVQVFTGKAVYKEKKRTNNSSTRRTYTYFISVIPDGEEKVIYSMVQVSEKEYEQITEGTPVLVVNKGPKACVL